MTETIIQAALTSKPCPPHGVVGWISPDIGKKYTENIVITIENAPPTIILTPGTPGPLDVSEGSDLVSRCSVLENEPFTFKWIRRLPDGSTQVLSQNFMLSLYQVTHQDIEYPIYCQATRSADGQIFEELLDIRVDQQYTVTIRPLTTEVIVGKPYELECEVSPRPDTRLGFRWYHGGRVVGDNAVLRIPFLAYPDIGAYICRAEWTPRQSRTGPIAANTTVEINLALTREMGIEMVPPPGNVMVTLPGETRELHCEFHHLRGSQGVQWFFNEQPLELHPTLNMSGNVHRIDRMRVSIVILRGVEKSHAGAYECRVNGDIRQTNVIVRDEDVLQINPSSDTVDEGFGVEFHCQSHGSGRPSNRDMLWFFRPFRGGPMTPLDTTSPTGFRRLDDPYALHTSFISKQYARKSDEGEYICRLGPNEAVARLFVHEDVLQINPSSDTVDEGFGVEFHCQSHGSGRPSNRDMLWFFRPFRGGPMTPLDTTSPTGFRRLDDPYALHTSFISKQYARKSDEGEYICRLGPNEAVARLFVRQIANYDVFITPPIIRVRAYQPIQIECYTQETSGRPSNVVPKHRIDRPVVGFIPTPIGENRLQISHPTGLGAEYNGTRVECYTEHPGKPASAIIVIESACPQGYRRCRSGQCIPAGRFCDGQYDCIDQSDEDPLYCKACDPISKPCEEYNGRAPHKKHYMIHWECDGEDDCGNGFDESRCPVIQSSPTYRYTTRPGRQVILQCRVIGRPIPRVIWRFNWGCLPDEGGRFRVNSVVENCDSPMPTVISTLTITGVQNGDDGIYNCEALAGATRAMSADYFVMLE
ncbi:hypothetical protein T265_05496 [Opisthorchis viverrini]|uniref:Ig-like domain-containing protein n=1 Tax=Opisthorchis viverrini TaxID=6198 RepID=A0A075AF83_OPIVI|nr:hypothetical protein T265_05496 [Opisthorchis viverrini]KER27459.1 hypothetical protein T265_05496 [Opisthorchis viverrini]